MKHRKEIIQTLASVLTDLNLAKDPYWYAEEDSFDETIEIVNDLAEILGLTEEVRSERADLEDEDEDKEDKDEDEEESTKKLQTKVELIKQLPPSKNSSITFYSLSKVIGPCGLEEAKEAKEVIEKAVEQKVLQEVYYLVDYDVFSGDEVTVELSEAHYKDYQISFRTYMNSKNSLSSHPLVFHPILGTFVDASVGSKYSVNKEYKKLDTV